MRLFLDSRKSVSAPKKKVKPALGLTVEQNAGLWAASGFAPKFSLGSRWWEWPRNRREDRRRAWNRERPTEHLPETGADSGELGALDRSLLWPLVCALPERQRAVIVLRYYEDMSEAQIADAMGCAPGTVKSQSSAAMAALRRGLAASGVVQAAGGS